MFTIQAEKYAVKITFEKPIVFGTITKIFSMSNMHYWNFEQKANNQNPMLIDEFTIFFDYEPTERQVLDIFDACFIVLMF